MSNLPALATRPRVEGAGLSKLEAKLLRKFEDVTVPAYRHPHLQPLDAWPERRKPTPNVLTDKSSRTPSKSKGGPPHLPRRDSKPSSLHINGPVRLLSLSTEEFAIPGPAPSLQAPDRTVLMANQQLLTEITSDPSEQRWSRTIEAVDLLARTAEEAAMTAMIAAEEAARTTSLSKQFLSRPLNEDPNEVCHIMHRSCEDVGKEADTAATAAGRAAAQAATIAKLAALLFQEWIEARASKARDEKLKATQLFSKVPVIAPHAQTQDWSMLVTPEYAEEAPWLFSRPMDFQDVSADFKNRYQQSSDTRHEVLDFLREGDMPKSRRAALDIADLVLQLCVEAAVTEVQHKNLRREAMVAVFPTNNNWEICNASLMHTLEARDSSITGLACAAEALHEVFSRLGRAIACSSNSVSTQHEVGTRTQALEAADLALSLIVSQAMHEIDVLLLTQRAFAKRHSSDGTVENVHFRAKSIQARPNTRERGLMTDTVTHERAKEAASLVLEVIMTRLDCLILVSQLQFTGTHEQQARRVPLGPPSLLLPPSKPRPSLQLIAAIQKGANGKCRELLESKADPNSLNADETPALVCASSLCSSSIIFTLVQFGASVNIVGANGVSSLHAVASSLHERSAKCCQLLLEHDADPNLRAEQGLTPLHMAVRTGNTAVAELLLPHTRGGGNVAAANGDTPLHLAAKFTTPEQLDLIALLLVLGGSPEQQNSQHKSPIDIATHMKVKALLEAPQRADSRVFDRSAELLQAVVNEESESVVCLLKEKAHVEATESSEGESALMLAVHSQNSTIIQALLDSRAFIDRPGRNGLTALHIATQSKKSEHVVQLLMQSGASLRSVTETEGLLPAHLAVQSNQPLTLQMLIKADQCVSDIRDGFKNNLLHCSIQCQNYNMSKILIYHRLNACFEQNCAGLVPTQLAKGDNEITQHLVPFLQTIQNPEVPILVPQQRSRPVSSKRAHEHREENRVTAQVLTLELTARTAAPVTEALDFVVSQNGAVLADLGTAEVLKYSPAEHSFDSDSGDSHSAAVVVSCTGRAKWSSTTIQNSTLVHGLTARGFAMQTLRRVKNEAHLMLSHAEHASPRPHEDHDKMVAFLKKRQTLDLKLSGDTRADLDASIQQVRAALKLRNKAIQVQHLAEPQENSELQRVAQVIRISLPREEAPEGLVAEVLARSPSIQIEVTHPSTLRHPKQDSMMSFEANGEPISRSMSARVLVADACSQTAEWLHPKQFMEPTTSNIPVGHTTDVSAISAQLASAAEHWQPGLVASLLELGAQPNVWLAVGCSLLHRIVSRADTGLTAVLLEWGAWPDTQDSLGFTPLHAAASLPRPDQAREIVRMLLQAGATPGIPSWHLGLTPLHCAIMARNSAAALDLIQTGMESLTEWRTALGDTSLHLAVLSGESEIVHAILDFGASLDVTDQLGRTPHVLAKQLKFEHISEVLQKHVDQQAEQELLMAAEEGDSALCLGLLEQGVDVQVTSSMGDTPLMFAASLGSFDICHALLQRKASVNAQDNEGLAPLHHAASGSKVVCQLLIQHAADVHQRTRSGWTPLHTAALMGSGSVVDLLLQTSDDINIQTLAGESPLHIASVANNIDATRVLIHHGADCLKRDRVEADGTLPIQESVALGHDEITELLASEMSSTLLRECGVQNQPVSRILELLSLPYTNIERSDASGKTSLSIAACTGNIAIVKVLLQMGANPNTSDLRGFTPLHFAATCPDESKADAIGYALIMAGAELACVTIDFEATPLHVAVEHDRQAIVQLFVDIGTPEDIGINFLTPVGDTALHIAALTGNLEITRLLLGHGATPLITNSKGLTPKHIAEAQGFEAVASALAEAEQAPNQVGVKSIQLLARKAAEKKLRARGREGKIVDSAMQDKLIDCASAGDLVGLRDLLSAGGNPDSALPNGITALHSAVLADSIDCLDELINAGATLDLGDADGWTAIHFAMQRCQTSDVARRLIEWGICLDATTYADQYLPLHVASAFGRQECVDMLLEEFLDDCGLNDPSNDLKTALHLAAEAGHLSAVQSILSAGADHRVRDAKGCTPRELAAAAGKEKVWKALQTAEVLENIFEQKDEEAV